MHWRSSTWRVEPWPTSSYASAVLICPSCGQENPNGFRFCGACASPLAEETAAPREERKIVTVLFADLVGFTAQAERLDPEEVRALLAPYYARVRAELESFGGTVEKFIGDAVMALFGAPTAHEDDPERAVRAALAIRDWALEREELCVRISVNTVSRRWARCGRLSRPAEQLGQPAGRGVPSGSQFHITCNTISWRRPSNRSAARRRLPGRGTGSPW